MPKRNWSRQRKTKERNYFPNERTARNCADNKKRYGKLTTKDKGKTKIRKRWQILFGVFPFSFLYLMPINKIEHFRLSCCGRSLWLVICDSSIGWLEGQDQKRLQIGMKLMQTEFMQINYHNFVSTWPTSSTLDARRPFSPCRSCEKPNSLGKQKARCGEGSFLLKNFPLITFWCRILFGCLQLQNYSYNSGSRCVCATKREWKKKKPRREQICYLETFPI